MLRFRSCLPQATHVTKITVNATLAGSIDDFDAAAQASYRATLASAAFQNASNVALTIAGGSVDVTAVIELSNSSSLSAAITTANLAPSP